MVNYTCVKCDKVFNQKSHLISHLKKKISCEHEEGNTCYYCKQVFSTNSSLKRHLKSRCKYANSKNNLMQLLLKQQEQIKKLGDVVSNFINTTEIQKVVNNNNGTINQVNQVTNNIRIEFGKEDLSKISNDFLIKTLINSSGALIPSKIIEGIHFNPQFREFMNVCISDLARNKAMIYDGTQWNIANANEVVDTLFDKAIIFCENRTDEINSNEKIKSNERFIKKIKKELYVMDIMNNHEPHDYNSNEQPIDIQGNILNPNELFRGKCLNTKAKEHLKNCIYNKKSIVLHN